jgi:hypothetical protein
MIDCKWLTIVLVQLHIAWEHWPKDQSILLGASKCTERHSLCLGKPAPTIGTIAAADESLEQFPQFGILVEPFSAIAGQDALGGIAASECGILEPNRHTSRHFSAVVLQQKRGRR